MSDTLRILGIIGSLRKGSYNRSLMEAAQGMLPEGVTIEVYEHLRDIPMYDGDIEDQGIPQPVEHFKKAIREADGLFIASPEYNYGIPGMLKNAIDWASRPTKDKVFKDKPASIIGASQGGFGTVRGQLALRQSLTGLGVNILAGPEVLVAKAQDKFDADRKLTDEMTAKVLRQHVEAMVAWVRKLKVHG